MQLELAAQAHREMPVELAVEAHLVMQAPFVAEPQGRACQAAPSAG